MRSLDELAKCIDNTNGLVREKFTVEEMCWMWAYAQAKERHIYTCIPILNGGEDAHFVGLVNNELAWMHYGPPQKVTSLKMFVDVLTR